MNTKETYAVVLVLTGVFLLQILVADAESRLQQSTNVTKLSPLATQALYKIANDDALRPKIISSQGILSQKKGSELHRKSTENINKQKTYIKTEKEGFIWYKPWTWF